MRTTEKDKYSNNNNLFNNKVYTTGALRQLLANQVALQGRSPMYIVFCSFNFVENVFW